MLNFLHTELPSRCSAPPTVTVNPFARVGRVGAATPRCTVCRDAAAQRGLGWRVRVTGGARVEGAVKQLFISKISVHSEKSKQMKN